MPGERHARLAEIADRLEAELRRLGRWSSTPLDPARLVDMGPFGMDTLAAEEWLQFVLLERLRELAKSGGELPATSETAPWAVRQFDGDDVPELLGILHQLDALVAEGERASSPPPSSPPQPSGDMAALARVLVACCERLPMVRAAHLAQIYAPLSEELSSALVAFDLSAPLPPDAFSGWPAEHPMIAFVLGNDAVSRLVRLTRPAYSASDPRDLRGMAAAIAAATQGEVLEVAGDYPALAVALPSGEVPILICAVHDTFYVNTADGGSWVERAGADAARAVPEVAARARAWAASHPGRVTMLALAIELAGALSAAFDERWKVSIPGAPIPKEMWLRGADHDAASVGVFVDGRAVVWVGDEAREVSTHDHAALAGTLEKVAAAVAEQRTRYQRHRDASEQIRALAAELTHKLAERLDEPGVSWEWAAAGVPSHYRAIEAEIFRRARDGTRSHVATVFFADARIRVHAGVPGRDGWDDVLTSVDAQLGEIAAAIARRLRMLSIDDLRPGKRYRVLQDLQELEKGQIVRYRGLDDIDNHHGEYDFEAEDGRKLVVAGDCSTPSRGPLGEVHRYLEALDDD